MAQQQCGQWIHALTEVLRMALDEAGNEQFSYTKNGLGKPIFTHGGNISCQEQSLSLTSDENMAHLSASNSV